MLNSDSSEEDSDFARPKMVAVGLPLNVSPSLEFRELNFGVVIVVHLGLENYPANYFLLFSKNCLVCTFFSSFEESNC